ncbi:hybrid sensor histidine kinase/response regulator [Stutzerimonas frequens]|uniref:hybrid sensor histidine kinase/response regulator n=1 Tax=Stutzerimonas frequens TaxID=2968969 RepID=UPI000D7DAB0E|nr:hybrid sensor histidine kinase/response regulator [Stutzerimonas frequens]AWT09121.1 hybrid sensor histidine kinase/response regulator [Stutzerimonas frequens]
MGRLRIAIALIFGLLLINLIPLSAQASVAPPTSTPLGATPNSLPQNWRILVDQSGKLTLEEVVAQRALFQRLEKLSYSAPASDRAVWLQVSLPPLTKPKWLSLFAPRVQYLDFYLLREGQLEQHIATGELRPVSARPLPNRAYLFSLPNDGQAREAYVRLQSSHPVMTWFKVIDDSGLVSQSRPAYLFGALFGALALLMVYNLLRFAYTVSYTHIWLSLLHGALLACAMANLGVLAVWLPGLTYSQPLIADLSALAASCALLGYTLGFFNQRRRTWITWLLGIELNVVLAIAASILLGQWLWHSWLIYSLVLVASCSTLVVALYHWRQGYQPARLVVAGATLFNSGMVFFMPMLLGFDQLDPGWLTGGLFSLATIAGLLLSFALLERQRQRQSDSRTQFTAAAVSSAELKTKADFLSKISHELRTPMNGVLGMSELLLGTSLSAKQRDYVQTIHSSGNELLNLINEILDISKLESGQIELDDVQFDFNALIEDCLSIFRAKAEQQKIELISFIQPQLPQVVAGDPTRLRQTLLNLLENAFKQTEEGEVLLIAAIDGPMDAPRLRITVQDSGRPLEAYERDALLNAAVDSQDFLAATRHGGRLGLIIARQLVQLMGGDFGIQTGSNQGNTLWISLPLAGEGLAQSNADLDGPLRGTRLLIVDDNDTCRKVLVQQCSSWGLEVSAVASGKEALALLRTKAHLKEYFDVVLLDQDMPGMTGMQLASKIKEDSSLNHDILLIMLTGMSSAPSKIIARNAGIKRILAKPVAGYTLKTTLADELAQRQQGNQQRSTTAPQASTPLEVPGDFRILVAEDNSISTKVIRGMLNKLNLQPDTACNGEEALEAIKATPYDLVLMDCEMPVLDGFQATRQLREWEANSGRRRTPVVALTAHILSEHRERAREAGMDGHMAKPVELSHLRELIDHWVRVKQAEQVD